jgi:hypothetical protein
MKDELIFNDISGTIRKALKKVYKENPDKTNISKTAFEIALRELI